MRKLIGVIFALLIGLSVARAQYSINAKDYCKPDDNLDDTNGLNAALTACSAGATMFIPAGNYVCNPSGTVTGGILKLDKWAMKRFKMIGEPGTKITTSLTGKLLYIYGQCENSTIEGIFFENTHSITVAQSNGIFLAGTSSHAIKSFTIKGCRFEGFSTAIGGQGVKGWTIERNYFAAPLGHDNAQNNTQPAVFAWFADNANGQCYDVKVLYNDVDGFTGSDISKTVTQRPMDGFIYGSAYGIQVEGNILRDMGEEYVLFQPNKYRTFYPISITKNKFYLSEPAGSTLPGNCAVRIDCNNWSITDNDFYDYTTGVLHYSFQFDSVRQHNFSVSGNRFWPSRDPAQTVREAIKVQGGIKFPAYNVSITSNQIFIDSLSLKSNCSAISVYNCEKGLIKENNVFQGKINTGSYSFSPIINEGTGILLYENDCK